MDFLSYGIPLGRFAGIHVRVHITLLLFAVYELRGAPDLLFGALYIVGLYFCILLHEFGHAFAARWCDGDCDQVLLWPLGGLAFARTPAHPTAELITAAAGPAVTLLLWLGFGVFADGVLAKLVQHSAISSAHAPTIYAYAFCQQMARLNLFLLLFNLIPAFPMDGGRIARALLWYRLGEERATQVAVTISKVVAVLMVLFAIREQQYFLLFIAFFVFMQASAAMNSLGTSSHSAHFSFKERLARGRRRAEFFGKVGQASEESLHRCTTCGCTEITRPDAEFRVASSGEEYCEQHLPGAP